MTFLFMLAGTLLGAWFCAVIFEESTGFTGAFFGLLIGLLLAQLRKLQARVAKLEQAQTVASQMPAIVVPRPTPSIVPPPTALEPVRASAPPSAEASAPIAPPIERATPAAAPPPPRATPAATLSTPTAPTEGLVYVLLKRWFTQGNVPVKIGVLVLFLGVAALLKYAADEGWLRVPIEFRLAGIAAAALAALAFAWSKRRSHRSFSLSLQGGAIGLLILTIFAAFRLYNLLPAGLAFVLLIVVVAGVGVLGVLQDSLALAVLGIVGGFLAPILVSTSNGNHVSLFSYYAVLNAAIFAIASVRPWRVLNLIGFAFTFVIGTAWGSLQYKPELFASTEPFLLLFFAFYLFIPVFYAIRQPTDRRDLIDGSLVFGTPLIVFLLQAALLKPEHLPLAYSAIGAAAMYTSLAAFDLRRLKLKFLGESHALLAIGFATIAIPLALSAQATACSWAIEGVALVWLGMRQQRRVPRWIGYGLQVLAGLAFSWQFEGLQLQGATIFTHGDFLGATLIALAGFCSARLIDRVKPDAPLSLILFFWGLGWWVLAFGGEFQRIESIAWRADAWIVFVALTGAVASECRRRLSWNACRYPASATLALAIPMMVIGAGAEHGGPLWHWSSIAWVIWLVASLRILGNLIVRDPRLTRILHFVFLWSIALLLGGELGYDVDRVLLLAPVWSALAGLLPIAFVFWLVLARNPLARWPLNQNAEALRRRLLASLAALLGLMWLGGLFDEGAPAPLPYLPLINPLELAQLGYLALLLIWYRRANAEGAVSIDAELRMRLFAIGGIALLTSITLRSVHFLGNAPWNEGLWESPLAQAALSITWTLAGIAAMLLGKRRGSRAIWIGGATLMAVVLIKLLLIDRRFLHDLPAIVGVLVVGVLLIGVGYFAPVPPRSAAEKSP